MATALVAQNETAIALTLNVYSETLELGLIRCDQRAQPREHLSTDLTQAYQDAMADGAKFPPLTVFFDGADYWLADGFHRRYAAIGLGLVDFPCEVKQGSLRDAILFSCQVNSSHGAQRTTDDKRRAVAKLLEDEEWSHWSNNEIAGRAKVSPPFVAKLREAVTPAHSFDRDSRTYRTKHGTIAQMNTGDIGRAENSTIALPRATGKRLIAAAREVVAIEPREPPRTPPGRGKAAICDRAREAILILSGLPPAHEIAGWFMGSDAASIISEHLRPAAAWLADFNDAWKDD